MPTIERLDSRISRSDSDLKELFAYFKLVYYSVVRSVQAIMIVLYALFANV
jgi:hypothetical protein